MRRISGCVVLLVVGCGSSQDAGTADDVPVVVDGGAGDGLGGAGVQPPKDAASGSGGAANAGGSRSTGGGANAGGSTGVGGGAGAGGSHVGDAGPTCTPNAGLPGSAPVLTAGTWKNISPPGVPFGGGDPVFTQGMAVDPCDPATLYLTVSAFNIAYGGLFKSTDAGSTWRRIGTVPGGGLLDEPIRVRVDPRDPQHMYVGDGVRGGTEGFWVSRDGGESFETPAAFHNLQSTESLFPYDVYDVAVDPTDFDHVLVAFHGAWGWTDTKWNTNSGVLESTDGGGTWIVHAPMSGWGTGHAVTFLYRPDLGVGDSKTWLLGTQGNGMYRTTDAGSSWTKVTSNGIQHGGGSTYFTKAGVLFASGADRNMRSTDNGATWTAVGPGGGYNAVGGDGKLLYVVKGDQPAFTSPETDGLTWTAYGTQQLGGGAFEIAFDAENRILYAAAWTGGLWALKPAP